MYYIYRITNNVNGKTYIGQHKYKNLNDNYMGSGLALKRAKEKYGIENFSKEILYSRIQMQETANDMEKFAIAKERTLGKAEYNIADGGEGGFTRYHTEMQFCSQQKVGLSNRKLSTYWNEYIYQYMLIINANKKRVFKNADERKKKLSEKLKGRVSTFKGKHHTKESKEKNRQSHLGKEPWNKGKKNWHKVTKEYSKNLSNGLKNAWSDPEKRERFLKNRFGLHWFNNGTTEIKAKECPIGFVPGRVRK